jgi:hypothetical protein
MIQTAPASYSITSELAESLAKYRNTAAFLGLLGVIACIAGWVTEPAQFYRSYLVGYFFWFGVSLGSLALLMVQHLTGGAWGMVIRRILEAGSRTLPYMAVLFIPILFGVPALYEWDDASKLAHDVVLQKKHLYLNAPFWISRVVIYFLIWNLLMYLLNTWSKQEDTEGGFKYATKMEKLSAPGIVIYVFTITFAVTDWVMSLTPHWFSTIFGFLTVVSQGLSIYCFSVTVLALLSTVPPMSHVVTKKHLHDLGKLMLAFVMLWAYMSFSQLLIIWSGNLPEEITWYLARLNNGWQYVALILLVFQFVVPFLILLSQTIKRNPKTLASLAVFIIAVRIIDVFWLVEPNFNTAGFHVSWLDFAAPLAVGGIFVALFLMELAKRPLMPLGAPDLQKTLAHGRHSH